MGVQAQAGGNWRNITACQVYSGAAWRNILTAKLFEGGVWRDVASFVQPLTASATPSYLEKGSNSSYTTTDPATMTPTGGLGPFTYSWTIISGTAVVVSPSSATTAFGQSMPAVGSYSALAQCTVTDSLGSTATDTVDLSFTRFGFSA